MTATPESDPFDALLAWLILLPALALAVPAGLLNDVPTTTSAGLGWTLIAFLPAAAVLALRRKPVAFRGSSLLLAVLVLASFRATRAGDPFEARRAVLALTLAFALTLGGASLGPEGRRVLLRGGALLSVLLVTVAVLQPAPHVGVLGNTGHTAQAALPGAIAGLAVARTSLGAMRWVGYAASAVFVLYAGAIPVLAGLVAFGAGAAGLLLASVGRRETALTARAGLLFLIAGAATFGVAGLVGGGGKATATGGDARLGGVESRQRTWTAAATSLLPAHLVWGVGPGQFAREFPPHRDPEERRLSSHGGAEPTPIDVEHAHNDVLQGLLDFGLVGGAAWLAFLVLVLLGAWKRLRSGDPFEVGLGACALGGWAAAWLHAPLLASPAAPAVVWPLFGAVLSRPPARTNLALALPGLAGLLLLLRADAAWNFTRHGAALARLADTELFEHRGVQGLKASEVAPHLRDALDACPDSPVALEKQSELLRKTSAPLKEQIEVLERLVAARPHASAPVRNLGIQLARAGHFVAAEQLLLEARRLAPDDLEVHRSLLRLSVDSFDQELLLEVAASMRERFDVDDPLGDLALTLVIAGRNAEGAGLLHLVDPAHDLTDLNEAYRLRSVEGVRPTLADAAHVAYNQLIAREHQAGGQHDTAVVMFRQALRTARAHKDLPGGDTLLQLELAGALAAAGKQAEAAEALEEARPSLLHWANLHAPAVEVLRAANLFRTF